ncbi:MAG: LapA family protein [Acidobacteriota bacterium]
MSIVRSLFYVLLGVTLAIFLMSNFEQRVTVSFTKLWQTREISLSLALFTAMMAGFLVGAVLAIADQLRLRSRLRQMRRSTERLEAELSELRKLPLTDMHGTLPAREAQETGPAGSLVRKDDEG